MSSMTQLRDRFALSPCSTATIIPFPVPSRLADSTAIVAELSATYEPHTTTPPDDARTDADDTTSTTAGDASNRSDTPVAVELDALELHRRLTGFQRLVGRARLEFLRLLAILDDGRRYLELGYSSTKHYLIQEFQLGRSDALEHIRIAGALRELPNLASALGDGEIRWSTLKQVTRVATPGTEQEWLEFAQQHTAEQVQHEVKRAIQERRETPTPPTDFGLSNVMSRISFEMTLEEKERFHTALTNVTRAMGEGAATDTSSVLTFLSQQILEGQIVISPPATEPTHGSDPDAGPSTAVDASPAIAIVYHQCPDCAASTVATPDGLVRVDPEVVDRLTDIASTTTITDDDVSEPEPLPDGTLDTPNPASLARKIRSRDGHRCQNPGWSRRDALHAHHIQFRRHRGRTAMANEVTLCRTCHTLVHAGLATIDRTASGELTWIPRAAQTEAWHAFDPFPHLSRFAAPQAPGSASTNTEGTFPRQAALTPSTSVDDSMAIDLDALGDGMTTMGYTKQDARRCLDAAVAALEDRGVAVNEATLLGEALGTRVTVG